MNFEINRDERTLLFLALNQLAKRLRQSSNITERRQCLEAEALYRRLIILPPDPPTVVSIMERV